MSEGGFSSCCLPNTETVCSDGCCSGACTPPVTGSVCCPSSVITDVHGGCCPEGTEEACSYDCCAPGEHCVERPATGFTYCCPPGTATICEDGCCPGICGGIGTYGGPCCPSGLVTHVQRDCCPVGSTEACSYECCESGKHCVPDPVSGFTYCCPDGMTASCNGTCVDTTTDPNYCGGCFNYCLSGQCANSNCVEPI